jgi:hypothetical protein
MTQRTLVFAVWLLGGTACGAGPAPGQPAAGWSGERLDVPARDVPQEADWRLQRRLLFGREPSTTPEARRVLGKVARWLTYRLTWIEVLEGQDVPLSDTLAAIFDRNRAFPAIPDRPPVDDEEALRRERQREYLHAFTAELLPAVRKVLHHDQLIARVNAARILARLAEEGQAVVAADLAQILEHPYEHDAVRLWAIKGLREVFRLPPAGDEAVRQRAGVAVCQWLDARCRLEPRALAGLSAGEVDGLRYLRREAIRALAEVRRPWVIERRQGKGWQREGPVADLLYRLATASPEVAPAPSRSERVEAADGLCRIPAKQVPGYHADLVAHAVARLATDLDLAAHQDEGRDGDRWPYYAVRLAEGFQALHQGLAAGDPAAAYVGQVLAQTRPVLENLFDAGQHPQGLRDLHDWLRAHPPTAQALYGAPE